MSTIIVPSPPIITSESGGSLELGETSTTAYRGDRGAFAYEGALDFYNDRELLKNPTGFTNNQNITVTYDSTTRKVTLNGTFEAYYRGEKINALVDGWVSDAHATTLDKSYFLKHNGTTFSFTDVPWTFDDLMICVVQYGTNNKIALKETHGFMQPCDHLAFHSNIGTYKTGGGSLTAGSYVLASQTVADKRPLVDTTSIQDEDLPHSINALVTKAYTQKYLTGASNTRNFTVDALDIIPLSGNVPYYNQFTGGVWTQTLIPNNNYCAVFVTAIPVTADATSQKYRYIWVQPQTIGTLADIEPITHNDIVTGDTNSLLAEYVPILKLILYVTGNNWSIHSVTALTGNKFIQSGSPSGNYLTIVASDATIDGDGTSANPLTVPHVALTNNPHSVTKTQVGLGNVDNTSDANKPISTATATALAGKEPSITGSVVTSFWSGTKTFRDLATDVRAVVLTGLSTATGTAISATDSILSALGKLQKQITDNLSTLTTHTGNTSNPHSTTASQVGLGNVTNESKATMFTSPAFTAIPTAPTASVNTNTTQLATTEFVNAEINNDRPFEATASNIKMNGTQAVGSLGTVARGDHVHPIDTSREPSITSSVVTSFWSGTKTFRDLATDVRAIVLTGLSVATSTAITATDTILVALGKLQAQITSHVGNVSNPHSVTKTQVGLSNVDNTSDANKPISTATQTALNLKFDKTGGNISAPVTITSPMTNGAVSAFTTPHLALKSTDTVDVTGFVGMTFDTSTSANYGYSFGALRSSNGNGDLVTRFHTSSIQGVELMRLATNGNLNLLGSITSPTFIGALNGNATTSTNTTGNSATTTKLATSRTISLSGDVTGSIGFDGSANVTIPVVVADDSHNHIISNIDNLQTTLDVKSEIPFVVGTQTGVTGAWTGIASSITTLADGQTIRYWLPWAGSGDATLNLTLSGGGTTGAIACYYGGTTRLTTHYQAGSMLLLTYVVNRLIGTTPYTGWWADANYADGTEAYVTRWNSTHQAGADPIYSYKLVMFGADGRIYPLTLETGTGTTKTVSTREFAIDSPILYYGTTTTLVANGTSASQWYNGISSTVLNYTANQASGFTAYKPIYLKGTILSNGNFKLDNTTYTSWLTQTLPTTEDGFVYMLLGYMYSTTTSYRLTTGNPILEYRNGKLQLYSSKITKAEVESVLTGQIESHTHPATGVTALYDEDLTKYTRDVTVRNASNMPTEVQYKRYGSATLFMKRTYTNPDANAQFQTVTELFYDTNGTTLLYTVTWTLTYGVKGEIDTASRVIA